jgi:cytochrome c2
MLATGDGKFYWLAQAQDGLRAAPLAIPDVMAREAYLRDFDDPSRAPRLRLTDVLIEQSAEPKALYLAHQAWDQKSRCYTLQLSTIALTWSGDGSPRSSGQWRTIFESKPCIKATGLFDDSETGGRLAWGPDGELLLSLGDLGFAGLDGDQPYSQRRDVDYGKIVKVDPRSGRSSIFSVGHRNPEGLLVASDGRIWESEHGPQGGDEINLIAEGENYGWPLATYGAEYGSHAWPLNPDGHDHGAFHEPAVAFVPSVALSSMIELAGPEFPHWKGDLIAASLRTETLYRLRLKGDRVIYVEPLPLGYRIRDLIQRPDGKVIVWSDTGTIMELSRDERDDAYDRTCSGCHEPRFGGAAGPPLAGVLGRRIASVPGFNYSAGLKSRTGRWSESELDAFLRDPDAYAPGTTMKLPGLDDESRAQVIAHLAAK